jgi:hypothetical protein
MLTKRISGCIEKLFGVVAMAFDHVSSPQIFPQNPLLRFRFFFATNTLVSVMANLHSTDLRAARVSMNHLEKAALNPKESHICM